MGQLVLLAQEGEPTATVGQRLEAILPWLMSPWSGALVAALGVWLMITLRRRAAQGVGAIVALLGVGLLAAGLPAVGEPLAQVVFWLLAGVATFSAVATVASRSPVYSAVWFALTLTGTAGILLLQGAQFLGVATIVVYAGAILVTFLFVLMLAQPTGEAYYDRLSWGRLPVGLAALAGGLIVGGVAHLASATTHDSPGTTDTSAATATDAAEAPPREGHVEQLGGRLFSQHLVAVQMAGVLLFAALVGAVAIAIHGKQMSATGGEPSHE